MLATGADEQTSISTHSLTRRLTTCTTYFNELRIISTHSLTRRLTADVKKALSEHYISTHSLTRRLTTSCVRRYPHPPYFNSQPHKEADRNGDSEYKMRLLFQLTASQGG